MNETGKIVMAMGVLIFIAGLFLWLGGRVPFLGKLPGDLAIKGKNFAFYFPFATSILLSILLSLVLYLIRKFF